MRSHVETGDQSSPSYVHPPEAAVVIDVRHCDRSEELLLEYLQAEVEDLAKEMRQVPGWSSLSGWISLLRLQTQSSYGPKDEAADFIITPVAGKPFPLVGRANLTSWLGQLIDRARNQRISVSAALAMSAFASHGSMSNMRHATTRVFFLADMRDHDSLTRAATYANWLKTWTEESHGNRRFDRDERLQTILFCLNTDAAHYGDILLQTVQPEGAIDTIILLHTYGDNELHIDEYEQIFQAELLLYTLLLHWPGEFLSTIDDPPETRLHAMQHARMLPWPTYTTGIAALEYSARWAARWLDYGAASRLLSTLCDVQNMQSDQQQIERNIQKWMSNWWQEMQAIVPDMFVPEVDELQPFAALEQEIQVSNVPQSNFHTFEASLERFRQQVSEYYKGSLQRAMRDSPPAILEQFRWIYASQADEQEESASEPYKRLVYLYSRLRGFLHSHFLEAQGAIPRARQQLAVLREQAKRISEIEQQPPNLDTCRQQFEQQAQHIANAFNKQRKIWFLPGVGEVLRSTVLSILLVVALGLLGLFVIDWQALVNGLAALPGFNSLNVQDHSGDIILGCKVALILLLIGAEWLYLAKRRQDFRRQAQHAHLELRATIEGHMKQFGTVIAARVALSFLQATDLYAPGEPQSPCEQRLQAVEQSLQKAQKQASYQQELADRRMRYTLGMSSQQQESDSMDEHVPGLHNRFEMLEWAYVENALMQSLQASSAANLLAEMLLREVGPETQPEILEDMVRKRRWLTGEQSEARFQALHTLLLALLLAAPAKRPDAAQMLPLLQEYLQLKELYQVTASPVLNETYNLASAVRDLMLTGVRSSQAAIKAQDGTSAEAALSAWIADQHASIPQLAQVFASNDVIERLDDSALQPSQLFEAFYSQGTLLGRPDTLTGENHDYLLYAPGENTMRTLKAHSGLRYNHIQAATFPDREKLVYLRIHRIRLIPSDNNQT